MSDEDFDYNCLDPFGDASNRNVTSNQHQYHHRHDENDEVHTLMRQVKLLRRELESLAKTRKDLKQRFEAKNTEIGGEKEREKEGEERDLNLGARAFRFAHADELDI